MNNRPQAFVPPRRGRQNKILFGTTLRTGYPVLGVDARPIANGNAIYELIGADPYVIRYTCSYTAKAQHDLRATKQRLLDLDGALEKRMRREQAQSQRNAAVALSAAAVGRARLASACNALSKSTVCPLTQTAFHIRQGHVYMYSHNDNVVHLPAFADFLATFRFALVSLSMQATLKFE